MMYCMCIHGLLLLTTVNNYTKLCVLLMITNSLFDKYIVVDMIGHLVFASKLTSILSSSTRLKYYL